MIARWNVGGLRSGGHARGGSLHRGEGSQGRCGRESGGIADFGSYGGGGRVYLSPARDQQLGHARHDNRDDNTKAYKTYLRTVWADGCQLAHRLLAGAPPASMNREAVQNLRGSGAPVSRLVYHMLASLTDVDVAYFRPRGANPKDAVPLDVRMRMMADSVMKMVKNSIPLERGDERQLCRSRAEDLSQGFARGRRSSRQAGGGLPQGHEETAVYVR